MKLLMSFPHKRESRDEEAGNGCRIKSGMTGKTVSFPRKRESRGQPPRWIHDRSGMTRAESLRGVPTSGRDNEAISFFKYPPLAARAKMRRAAADNLPFDRSTTLETWLPFATVYHVAFLVEARRT